MKVLSYILFEDEEGNPCVGFNKHNSPGFIDDGYGWTDEEREDFYDRFVYALGLDEIGSFTFQFPGDEAELENKLIEMGLKSQEQGW